MIEEELGGGLIDNLVPPASTAEGPSAQADAVPWGISIVKAPMCWEATKGKGIYVAVIDTGIAPSDLSEHNLYCS